MADGPPLPEVVYLFESAADSVTAWRVLRVHFREALSELYELTVDLACDDATVDPEAMFSARATLLIQRDTLVRRVLGVVRRVDDLGTSATQHVARVTLVPELWALTQRSSARNRVGNRIFQDKTTLEIVRAVLDDAGLYAGPRLDTAGVAAAPPAREYTVQYRESDLSFVQRLLEDDGVGYYFRHDGDTETLCLFDGTTGFPQVPTMDHAAITVRGPEMATASVESIRRFDFTRELRPTSATVRDYNFTRTMDWQNMTRTHPRADPGAREIYESPAGVNIGGFDGDRTYTTHDGKRQAEIRDVSRRVGDRRGRALTNVTGMATGMTLELSGHGRPGLDGHYLVTRVEHSGFAADQTTADSALAQHGDDRYHNTVECVALAAPWRPARVTPRPVVHGSQTARVVGPPGEEIYTDHHGRIKVQFHWDREGTRDDQSSAWVRTQQAWAGPGWGFVFIPRVGMEVVVTFLEGDPDHPLVTGSVYNSENPTPYPLPDDKTRSTIKSSSSPGGHGFNELRFEDLAHSEEIFLHAQKDFNEVVNNDHSTHVHHDQSNTVDRDQKEVIHRDRGIDIDRNDTQHIKGHQMIHVDGQGPVPAGGPPAHGAGLKVTGEYTVEATEKLTLKVGGSTLVMVPGTITLTAGGHATLVLDANAHMRASGNGDLLLDANAHLRASGGGDLLLDANAHLSASGGGDLLLDANAHLHASGGGDLVLDANAHLHASGGGDLVLDANAHVHGTDVLLEGTTLHAEGGGAKVTLAGSADITGSTVNLNA